MQHGQGKQEIDAKTSAEDANGKGPARRTAGVPTKLSSRKLARLSVLGY